MRKVLLLILPILVWACNKDTVTQNNDAKRLKKIVDSHSISTTFNYDNQNKLINKTDTSVGSTYKTYINVFYDSQGKISGYIYGDNQKGNIYSYTFNYTNGKIIRKAGAAISDPIPPPTHGYSYDAEGRLFTDTIYFNQIPSVSYSKFFYSNGNITESQHFSNNSTVPDYIFKSSFDNNLTSCTVLDKNLYFVFEDQVFLNKNNVIETIDPANSSNNTSIKIEFYPNKMPKKADYFLQGRTLFSTEYFYD